MRKLREINWVFVNVVSMTIIVGWLLGVQSAMINNFGAQSITLNALSNRVETLEIRHEQDVEELKKSIVPRKLTVTAYTASVYECDSDPKITASMQKVRPGIIAVSRDLFEAGWVFGKKVYIEDYGVYEIADLMNSKYENRIDIFVGHKKKANDFGKRELTVALLHIEK